jgi:hypothetical protein
MIVLYIKDINLLGKCQQLQKENIMFLELYAMPSYNEVKRKNSYI